MSQRTVDTDVTATNVAGYTPWDFDLFRAEAAIFDRFLRPGIVVLDLGCGNGRVGGRLARRRLRVLACDVNLPALAEFHARLDGRPGVSLFGGDARSLPLPEASVDAVVFAYNGLDMIGSEEGRAAALAEVGRVLRPGGIFVVSSHNPIGTILSPRALRSRELWRLRVRHVRSGAFRRPTFDDVGGGRIHQARPGVFLRQVRAHAGLEPVGVWATRSGIRSRVVAALFSAWPTYVFRNPDAPGRPTRSGPPEPGP